MGRIIKRRDIRKGDKIIIHRTVEVATDLDDDGDFKDASGNWVEVSEFDREDGYEIELVNRPNPPLPTTKGSVIKVLSNSGSGRWMLTDSTQDLPHRTPNPVWVSAANVNYTPSEMSIFLDSREDRTFEVVA